MTEKLVEHIKHFIPVSAELENMLQEICTLKTVEKGVFLHKPNRICEDVYFINSGLLRLFYKKGDKEITDDFSAEGEWLTSIYSYMKNVPDHFYIETLERSEMMKISLAQFEQCFIDFPEMERFGRLLISHYFIEKSERVISLQFHSAKEKYAFFCQTSKNKAARVPLGMLASYLGITQETLSRIRADKGAF